MKLIIQPEEGVSPLLAAIKGAKKRIDIAIFRADRKDIENALNRRSQAWSESDRADCSRQSWWR